jgi:hypothetical protein
LTYFSASGNFDPQKNKKGSMKLKPLLAITVFAAALPALAAPTCNPPMVVQGNNCTLLTGIGWATAGLGTDSVFTIYVPPGASGPVNFHITALSSMLGSAYTGYFGIKVLDPQAPGGQLITLADILAGNDIGDVSPGQAQQFSVTQVCWDPTCTSAPPTGAVPNMFSMQIVLSSPNSADINPNLVQMAVRFLNGAQVTFEEQETAVPGNAPFSLIPGINLGATPAGRYVYTGTAVNLPFDVLSVSNLNNSGPLTATVTLKDFKGNNIATAPVPAIPPEGAAGFLVIGRTPGDPLGLFPSSTVLPAGSDGIFHGILEVAVSGRNVNNGRNIVLAQEFNGNTMLNLPVFRSQVP